MKKILSTEQIREADAFSIQHEPIASIDLMERAARACAERILELGIDRRRRFRVFCGMGNNGGDGLAIARMLLEAGYTVSAVVIHHLDRPSTDQAVNRQRLSALGVEVLDLGPGAVPPAIDRSEVVIDAMLGSGLSRPVDGLLRGTMELINASGAQVIAIDVPSGLNADGIIAPGTVAIRADRTLSLELPKLAFFFAENAPYVGKWDLLPIGLDAAFIGTRPSHHQLLEEKDARAMLLPRHRFAHKGDFGHALLIAGGKGKMGAAVLAAKACLRSGAGLCTVHLPASGVPIMQAAVPEAMCSAGEDPDLLNGLPLLAPFNAMGIGPGMGTAVRTAAMMKLLIQEAHVPLVIDADALNILAMNKTWLGFLPRGTILTPHPKEFDRLAGNSPNGIVRLERARENAVKWNTVIVLKGAFTAICDPNGQVTFNPTGNPGMAKGGSGDVLTGLLAGLLAQGYPPLDAARLGAYLHGLAGDLAAAELGMDGMTAIDLVGHLPVAWRRLREGVA